MYTCERIATMAEKINSLTLTDWVKVRGESTSWNEKNRRSFQVWLHSSRRHPEVEGSNHDKLPS